jgi:hypothetical protein
VDVLRVLALAVAVQVVIAQVHLLRFLELSQ